MLRTCSSCGAEVPEQFPFCGFCAAPFDVPSLSSPAPRPAIDERSARRLVTVLFADLTNFTRAAERADPEEIYLTVRDSLERLAGTVTRLGGRIDHYIGDGFLATFGVPEAHEDDPSRAVLAALQMQQLMSEVRVQANERLGWEVQLRVGLNTGEVISGQVNTGALLDSSVYGAAVNLASRLQEAARPGTILVSEEVFIQTRAKFNFNEPAPLELKGIDRQVLGYEVLGQRAESLPTRGLSGRTTPLIGRSRELQALATCLQRMSVERKGVIALVTGEAGVGKSRLVGEALLLLSSHIHVVRVGCSPTRAASYALLAGLIEALAGVSPEDPGSVRQQRLDHLLSPSETLAREIGPVLSGLIGSPTADDRIITDPKQEQRRIFAATRRLLAWSALRRPLLLVLDDLHWADPSSLDVIGHITDLVHETPLGLIAIARHSAREELPPALLRANPADPAGFLDIALQTLSAEESDRLLTHLLSELTAPPDFKRTIVDRTSGSPLLLEEMVRMLLDRQVIRETRSGWKLDSEWPSIVQNVPDTVNGLMLSRYDRLPPPRKSILDSAAVLGPAFSLPLLAAMTTTAEAQLQPELVFLEGADFVRRTPGSGVPTYYFRHALMQEAIYQTILHKERQALHLRAAQLVQQMADDLAVDRDALIGHHLERGKSPQAVVYLTQAAERAASRYANQEAIAAYERVQTLLPEQEIRLDMAVDAGLGLAELLARTGQLERAREQLERCWTLAAGPPAPGYRMGDILYQFGIVHTARGAHGEALASFLAAATVCQQAPAQCKSFSQADVERERGWVMFVRGQIADARERTERALQLGHERQDLRAIGSAHNLLAGIHYWAGDLTDSVASALEALSIRELTEDIWGAAATQTNLGGLYFRLGNWSQADSFLRQAIFVQQEIGDHHGLGSSWNTLGLLLLGQGRSEEALNCMDQAIATLREQQHLQAFANRYNSRGGVRLRLGQVAGAVSDLERSLEAAVKAENDDLQATAVALLAETWLRRDQLRTAMDLIQHAESLLQASRSWEARGEVLRVKSLLLRAGGDCDGARQANHQAQELLRRLGDRYELARRQIESVEMELAWLEASASRSQERGEQGNGKDQSVLDPKVQGEALEALATFRELHARSDIPVAEDLLARVNSLLLPAALTIPTGGLRPVTIVNLRLHVPEGPDEGMEKQELVADLLNRLTTALREVGKTYGAVVIGSASGLTYLLSGPGAERHVLNRGPGSDLERGEGGGEGEGADRLALTAVECALSAVDTGVRLNAESRRRLGPEAPVCIGIASGLWQESVEDPQEAAIFASVSQIGRRAQAAASSASPGQILLAGDMFRSVRQAYELDPVEFHAQRRLPGATYRLGRARADHLWPHPLPGASLRLIGRDAELALAREWIDRIKAAPQGQVCYLEAEAGMGKTRLMEEVLAYSRSDLLILLGKCESFRSGFSYWVLSDMLDHVDLPASEKSSTQRLKSLLGLHPPDSSDETLLRSLPPAHLRQELFARVREFLLQEAGDRPVLFVVEDIHWIDLSSLDLLDFLLPLTLEARISLLLIARAEMAGPHRAFLSKAERVLRDRYLRISLSGFSESESLGLIQELLETPRLPTNLWKMLEPFAGHPLSLEEGLRFLVERGWLWKTEDDWQVADIEHSLDRRVPATFKDLLLGRLDALDSGAQHVLQAAAVLGENFDRTVLSRIVPDVNLPSRLTELADRGWLFVGAGENPLLYRFKHTLSRETIYGTLLATKKQVLHQRAGEAIESLYPEAQEERAEVLAYHFSHSSVREKSLHYLVRAGQKSATRYALAESVSYYRKAQEFLERDNYPRPRLAAAVALGLADVYLERGEPGSAISGISGLLDGSRYNLSSELRAACLRRMGTARRVMGEFSQALEDFQDARRTLVTRQEFGVHTHNGTASRIERELLEIELGEAQTLFEMRENERARERAEHFLGAIDRQQHPEHAARLLNLLGGIAHRQEIQETAERLVQESLTIYQAYGNRSGAAGVWSNLGILAAARGDPDTAHDNFSLSLALREALGDSQGIANARNNLGKLEKNRGRYPQAIQHLNVAVETARLSELSFLLAQSLSNLGQVLLLINRMRESLTTLEEAEALCRSHNFRDMLCEVLCRLAECWMENGNLVAAEEAARSALTLAVELEGHDLESEARRGLGRVYRKMGSLQMALELSRAAWQAHEDDLDPVQRARFAAEYALALRGDDPDEALRLLREFVAPVTLPESCSTLQEISEALRSLEAQLA